MTGFPDWQAYPNFRDNARNNFQGRSFPNGTTSYNSGLVTNWASVLLVFEPQDGPLEVILQYYDDDAQTVPSAFYAFSTHTAKTLTVIVPNLGNSLQLQILNTSGGALHANGYLQPTNIAVTKPVYVPAFNGAPMIEISQSINSGVVLEVTSPVIAGGSATWAVGDATGNLWDASLKYWDASLAAWTVFAEMHGADRGKAGVQRVSLPPAAVLIHIRNNEAAAATFNASLVAD